MPPPPPPPPPGMGGPPPPPPPPPANLPSRPPAGGPKRDALLGDIQKGTRLKKAVTNDRSAPLLDGKVSSSISAAAPSAPAVPGMLRPPGAPAIPDGNRNRASSDVSAGPPQLGGLFAGGMPKLRKAGGGIDTGADRDAAYSSEPEPRSAPLPPRITSAPLAKPPTFGKQSPLRPVPVPGSSSNDAPPAPSAPPPIPGFGLKKAPPRPSTRPPPVIPSRTPDSRSSPEPEDSTPSAPSAPPPPPSGRAPPPLPGSRAPPVPPAITARKPAAPSIPPPAPVSSQHSIPNPFSAPPPPPSAPPIPSARHDSYSDTSPTNGSSITPSASLAAQAAVNAFRSSHAPSIPPPRRSISPNRSTSNVDSYSQPPPAPPPPPVSAAPSTPHGAPPPPPPSAPISRPPPPAAPPSRTSLDPSAYMLSPTDNGSNGMNGLTPSRSSFQGNGRVTVEDGRFNFKDESQLPKPRDFAGFAKRYRAGRVSTVPLDLKSLG